MKEYYKELEWEGSPLVLMITPYEEDNTAELLISRKHYSVNRDYSFKSFDSLKDAIDYCKNTYQIEENDWGKRPIFEKKFVFEYSVTDSGTPQPYVEGFQDAIVKFEITPASNDEERDFINRNKIDITGNAAGLRKLAAQLLLCADSEVYDEYFHIHHTNEQSNLEVTLRAPNYFKANEDRQGEFILFSDNDGFSSTNFCN